MSNGVKWYNPRHANDLGLFGAGNRSPDARVVAGGRDPGRTAAGGGGGDSASLRVINPDFIAVVRLMLSNLTVFSASGADITLST